MKTAISVNDQIQKLRARGMTINAGQEEKVREALLDIGYYRMGCYWFPFEVMQPGGNLVTIYS